MIKKLFGYGILLALFTALYTFLAVSLGQMMTTSIFVASFVITGLIAAAVYLITD